MVFQRRLSVHLFSSGHLIRVGRSVGFCDVRQVPRQQFGDAVHGMVGDPFEDHAQIELRVEAVELGGSSERVDGGSAFSAVVGAGEEEVLATQADGAQAAFGGIVVDLDAAVVDVARKRGPAREYTSTPSPISLTIRPEWAAIIGSINSRLSAFRRERVPASSIPMRREYPTTSADRIAASLLWRRSPAIHTALPEKGPAVQVQSSLGKVSIAAMSANGHLVGFGWFAAS